MLHIRGHVIDPGDVTCVIVGTGTTAPAIARAFTGADMAVRIAGRSPERARAVAAASGADVSSSGGLARDTFAGATLVIESVTEELDTKRQVLAQIEDLVSASTVVATNTSSLRVSTLASGFEHPERFAALHFLHPADRTDLVEVVGGDRTSPATLELLGALVVSLGKAPIRVNADIDGFVWNRLQFALFREGLALVEMGVVDAETVDLVVERGLAPRWVDAGPFAIAERGGVGTFTRIAEQLFPSLTSSETVPEFLVKRAEGA